MPEVKEKEVELTMEEKMDAVENKLIRSGVLVPYDELVEALVRNASYMTLIQSQQFKDSGIKLEEVLSDDFMKKQFELSIELVKKMRLVTEALIPRVQESLNKDLLEKATEVVEGTEKV